MGLKRVGEIGVREADSSASNPVRPSSPKPRARRISAPVSGGAPKSRMTASGMSARNPKKNPVIQASQDTLRAWQRSNSTIAQVAIAELRASVRVHVRHTLTASRGKVTQVGDDSP